MYILISVFFKIIFKLVIHRFLLLFFFSKRKMKDSKLLYVTRIFFFFFQWFIFIILKKSCSFNVFQWHFVILNSDSKGGKAIQNCLKSNRINTKTSCLAIFLTWNCVFTVFHTKSFHKIHQEKHANECTIFARYLFVSTEICI